MTVDLDSGPWPRAFAVVVEDAVSKSNFRRGDPNWARYRDFEFELRQRLRAARPSGWPLGEPDTKVAERPAFVGAFAAAGMIDAANLPKSVADAAEGVVYLSDAQLWACLPVVLRRTRKQPRTWVAFAQTTSDPAQQVAAAAALAARLLGVAEC